MSVFDASVVVDALVGVGESGEDARDRLRLESRLAAPQILRAEAISAFRGQLLRGDITERRARVALDQLRRLAIVAYPIEPLAGRVWDLRASVSVYDAWYVALAERLATALVTTDRRLAGANGLRCSIDLVGS